MFARAADPAAISSGVNLPKEGPADGGAVRGDASCRPAVFDARLAGRLDRALEDALYELAIPVGVWCCTGYGLDARGYSL